MGNLYPYATRWIEGDMSKCELFKTKKEAIEKAKQTKGYAFEMGGKIVKDFREKINLSSVYGVQLCKEK